MEQDKLIQHVFIIGCKGIPARYGGFETFVDKLTEYSKDERRVKYHVACAVDKNDFDPKERHYEYNGAHCFRIKWRDIGSAKAIFYDLDALDYSMRFAKRHNIQRPVFYILACRIGPFIGKYKKKIDALGGNLYVNPDGHEYKRAKWSLPVRKYWKLSEKLMVKHSDLLICDSKTIEKYIKKEYSKLDPKTTYISYGAELSKSILKDNDDKVVNWFKKNKLRFKEYYLIVGRFVPENNYEIMIREFMLSDTSKDLAIITNVDNKKYYKQLVNRTDFNKDKRIKFVGTVYDQELLKKIREKAYAYIHGHEVGGTNPSLLEALVSTELNLLLDVGFNREVAEDGAFYWDKSKGSLKKIIKRTNNISHGNKNKFYNTSPKRIFVYYDWEMISKLYSDIFKCRQKDIDLSKMYSC